MKAIVLREYGGPEVLKLMSQAVQQGKLSIPIRRRIPLKDAAAAHAAVESGLGGKVLLLAR